MFILYPSYSSHSLQISLIHFFTTVGTLHFFTSFLLFYLDFHFSYLSQNKNTITTEDIRKKVPPILINVIYKSVGSPFLTERKCSIFHKRVGLKIINTLNTININRYKYFILHLIIPNIFYNNFFSKKLTIISVGNF